MKHSPRPNAREKSPLAAATSPLPRGAFVKVASKLWKVGLLPIPCGKESGKEPLVRYKDAGARYGEATLWKWIADEKFRQAGVGVLTGAGRCPITVVDIDDPSLVEVVIERLGQSPIRVRTPSGGVHLWYRYNGERCANLRRCGWAVDIKAQGGFVVVPPSARPDTEIPRGKQYRFEAGSFSDLRDLPTINRAALDQMSGGTTERTERRASKPGASPQAQPMPIEPGGMIREGGRNIACFTHALGLARKVSDYYDLQIVMARFNKARCSPPLAPVEIQNIVISAWGYEERGENWCNGSGVSQITTDEMNAIPTAAAVALLVRLRQAHGSRSTTFAIAPRSMAAAGAVWDLGERVIRQARDELLTLGFLERTHCGGKGPGDPSLFRLTPRQRGGLV